jgi:uncharacterized LabA/DUF88 family protein
MRNDNYSIAERVNAVADAKWAFEKYTQEGMTIEELRNARYYYKQMRDTCVAVGVDVQMKQLPRTIKEKNLPYLMK